MLEIRETAIYAAWFSRLRDARAQARINARIFRLANGNPGDVKPVGDGVSEMRIDYGPGYRVYFIRTGQVVLLLLCGGDKSTQDSDIDRAKELARLAKG
ncbi:type II toxin-antitoxin system RelE/ParE family toxin [Neorhizobium sp. P12A]|uniref:type II toxin-antitoxin system RelE/ParE family toxin n=1 Tax=Neorhizobium sp. P12A TaxID=2268027 RepID=UPI0011ECA36E|nr:type II toxin-antitoxin system RelE/ParE family toxin [Neorhizobium sp. P12A]KAA0698189.1 type II toxin-antitoxin system RelE/ParE family toxin [Neorhizobium sp. P12A]